METAPRFRRVLSLLGLGALCLSLLGLTPQAAGADEVADKEAEAARIAAQVDELNTQIEVLAEKYNAAQDQLVKVQADEAAAEASLEQTKAEMAQRQSELAEYAVQAYVRGGDSGSLPVILGSEADNVGKREGYLSAAAGNRQQLLDRLEATRQDVEADVARLEQAQQQAQQVRDQIASSRSAVQATADQQKALLAKTQGELAQLVAQEQARRAAADAAAAKAREAAAENTQPAPGPAAGPPPSVSGGAAGAVAEAKRQLGVRYTWGGATPSSGFDCSGFTMWAWGQGGGVSLPHSSSSQYAVTTHIPMSSIQPGDLIFYGHPIHHVALYVGNGQIIHSPHEGGVVQYDSVYYWSELVGAGRV